MSSDMTNKCVFHQPSSVAAHYEFDTVDDPLSMMNGVEADASANQTRLNLGHFLFMPCQTRNSTMVKQSP